MSMMRSIASKWSGVMLPVMTTGSAKTMQMLKMLLPIMLPTKRSDLPRLAAVMVVTNSGRDVPIAMMVSEMMRSERPMVLAMVDAEFTTNWLPPITPVRPRITRRKDLPMVYSGFSTSFLADLPRRFLWAIVMR